MKAIVVEDSRLAREGLVKMLQSFPDIDVVGAADHPSNALILIKNTLPDVIFLDIHMRGKNGFDLLEDLDYTPRIVFTTAYSEYAIRSFDYNTVDYLLKPISEERLTTAINKLLFSDELSPETRPVLEINSKIFVKDGNMCHLIPLNTIYYFESCKNYVRIFFSDKNAFVKKSLNSIEARLPKKYFFRVNRQYIVNLNEIKNIEEATNDGYEITMNDGKLLDVSRRNGMELKELLSF
ncbi:MAG: LytTR family DNA-binding domain-containing protein [Pseudomonadota bacterium]